MTLRRRKAFTQTLRYMVAALALVFFLFPILWITLTAFKSGEEFLKSPPVWIPRDPSLQYFQRVIESGGLNALRNSLIIFL